MVDFVGILPAAGKGSRLGPIPCSKEIMPLGFRLTNENGGGTWQPVTAIESHLSGFKLLGVSRIVIIISESKSDIPRYLGDGSRYGLHISYVFQQRLRGMPFALDLAAPWMGTDHAVFSMPDTLIRPMNCFVTLGSYHQQSNSDVTLGLFETSSPHKYGMVELSPNGQIVGFVDKPRQTSLDLMWGFGMWSQAFTSFMTAYVSRLDSNVSEVTLSDVFSHALRAGMCIRGLVFRQATYHDIGTPEDFQDVVYRLAVEHRQVR